MEGLAKLNSTDWNREYRFGFDYTHITGENLDRILSFLPPNNAQKIALDLGSGKGQLARELHERGFSVTGLDLSYEAVKMARANSDPRDVHYEVADFETDFSAKFAAADLVTCRFVYAFIENRQSFLQSVRNLLKADGRFVVVNPLKSSVPDYKKGIALESRQVHSELADYFEIVDYYVEDDDEYFICKQLTDKTA